MGENAKKERPVRLPNIFEAVLPILVMMVLMIYGFVGGGDYTDAHMPLVISIAVACIIGGICGHSFSDMLAGMLDRLNATMEAILILCTVGILVATFIMSGTIPALIYYGLDLLTPSLFLPVGCLMVSIVSLACGSSWTATATIGIAFLGIGAGLGINPALTAGMVISGAYVGDKFSPLSDTTNLAAAVAQTGLFDHVTAMISTTAPTFIISLILYTILGLNIDTSNFDASVATDLQHALAEGFNLNPLVLLPIAVIIVVCILKMPGLVGIAISVGVGILCTMVFQGMHSVSELFNTLHYGITLESSNDLANELLSRGGMDSQMWTINLILLAVAYGGALERCGCIETLFGKLKHKLHSVGSLILATLLTSLFCDATMCDQFLGIGVPAPLYMDKYDEMGLGRNMLSRTLEDCGTLWAVMFPWTGCGAYQMGVLGVHPFAYFPFAFVNLLNPIYAAITAFLGRNIFWADGAYTNILGKTKMHKPAGAPEEAHELAVKNLNALREAGKAPKVQA